MGKLILRENLLVVQQKREFALQLIQATSIHSRLQFSLEFDKDTNSLIVPLFRLAEQMFMSQFDEQEKSSVLVLPTRYRPEKFYEKAQKLILQSFLKLTIALFVFL